MGRGRWTTALCLWVALAWCPGATSAASTDTDRPLDVDDLSAPAFSVYTTLHGLSDEIWGSVAADSQGFIWAGSASRIARFDGYGFTQWPVPAQSLVRFLHLDATGTLWAIFEGEGLFRLAAGEWEPVDFPESRLERFARSIDRDGRPRDWLLTEGGLYFLESGRWLPDPGNSRLGRVPMQAVAETFELYGERRQWALGSVGLYFRTFDAQGRPRDWQQLDDVRFLRIAGTDMLRSVEGGREELWVSSYGEGLHRISDRGIRSWRKAGGELPTEAIYQIQATRTEDGRRTLWMASRAGLLRLMGDEVTAFDRRHGLPSDAVRAMHIRRNPDQRLSLWMATEAGMARALLGETPWRTVSLAGARENGIFGVLVESDGEGGERLWLGTAMEGLHLLSEGQWRRFGLHDGSLPGNGVRSIASVIGPDGERWRLLGMNNGPLIRIHEDLSFHSIEVPWAGEPAEAVAAIHSAADSSGAGPMWLGLLRSGFARFDGRRWTREMPDGASFPLSVLQIVGQTDPAGRHWLWAATSQGIARHDGRHWRLLKGSADPPAANYRSLLLAEEGERTILMAGGVGVGVSHFDVSEPLAPRRLDREGWPQPPDPTVYSLLRDAQGRVYVCTNNGVQQLTPTTPGAWLERVFRRADGLVHDECNTGSQFIDRHDRYWVGTLAGLSLYDPSLDRPPAEAPADPAPLHYTGIRIGDQEQRLPDTGQPVLIPSGQREWRLGYTLLSGHNEPANRYRGWLAPYEDPPTDFSHENRRIFSNVPPGRYQFHLEAMDAIGRQSSAPSLEIVVEPRFWQQIWVQGLLALVLATTLTVAIRGRYRGLRRRQRELERLVAIRTEELEATNTRLTELSYQDPLTGIANRRRLLSRIESELRRAIEERRPIALLIIDVDHFKAYNDSHGHLAGDVALKAVSGALQQPLRDTDLLARFGGEEFACLLTDTPPEQAHAIAEQMRAAVAGLGEQTAAGLAGPVTISAGLVSGLPAPGMVADDLLRGADEALYQAKNNGRNRVCATTLPD